MDQQRRVILVALACLAAAGLVHVVVSWIEQARFKRRHGCKPARKIPQKDPILGLDVFRTLARNKEKRIGLEENVKAALTQGRTRTAFVMGQRFLSTCEPENIRAALATNFHDWGIGPRIHAYGPLLGRGIFTTDDAAWEHSRALIRPSFTRAQVADLDGIERHVQNLFGRIPADGETVDLQPLFFNFTIDSATDFLFGRSVNCQIDPNMERFSEAFDYAENAIERRARFGKLASLVVDRRFDEACRIVHGYIDTYIAETVDGGGSPAVEEEKEGQRQRYNLLAELASACPDRVRLRHELLNVLLAARDTTAAMLSSVFYFLARHPSAWRRLQAEVDELDGRLPEYQDIKNMRYLKSVLDETLRLHPPVPGNLRFARRHTTLPRGGGPDGKSPVFVAKGTALHYTVWAMHRLPDVYGSDAEDFRPERWLPTADGKEKKPLRPGWAYLPFNGGPRICLGQQNALVEGGYVVTRVMQAFNRAEVRGGDFRENLGLTLSNFNGTKLALWRRRSGS